MNPLPFVLVSFFVVLPAMFVVVGVIVFLYLRTLFVLVEHLEKAQPVVWQALGSPRGGETCMTGPGRYGTLYHITPFMPLARWLISSEPRVLDAETQALVRRARFLFAASTVAFGFLFAATIGTIMVAESMNG